MASNFMLQILRNEGTGATGMDCGFHNWTLYSYDCNKHAGTGIFIQETELQNGIQIYVCNLS